MRLKRVIFFLALFAGGLLLMGAGCSSDPNVEGAKLDLRNKNIDKALNNIDTALENNPENPEAWLVKGDAHKTQLQSEKDLAKRDEIVQKMVEAYQNALQYGAEKSAVTRSLQMTWVGEMQSGGNAYKKGSENEEAYDKAIHYFGNATTIQPDSVSGYVNLAYAHLASGQEKEAIQPFEEAIDRGANEVQVYTLLAQLYQRNDQAQEAVTLLEEAREAYPENSEIMNQLLNAYVATDQIDKARDNFKQAVTKNPENKIYRYNYGTLLLQAKAHDEAIKQLEKAVEIDPSYADALYQLGAAYQNKAVSANDQISELDAQLRNNRSNLSDAEIKQQEEKIDQLVNQRSELFKKAVDPLVKARQIMEQNNEDTTGVCRALFQAYAQTNQEEKAREAAQCAGIDVN